MTIEEIKVWRERIKTHGLGMAEGKPVVGVIDTLLEEVTTLEKHNASSDQAVVELDQKLTIATSQLAVATEALEEIIINGDYTAPEGMKLIARTALERIKE